jgi:hypothetical protein
LCLPLHVEVKIDPIISFGIGVWIFFNTTKLIFGKENPFRKAPS